MLESMAFVTVTPVVTIFPKKSDSQKLFIPQHPDFNQTTIHTTTEWELKPHYAMSESLNRDILSHLFVQNDQQVWCLFCGPVWCGAQNQIMLSFKLRVMWGSGLV